MSNVTVQKAYIEVYGVSPDTEVNGAMNYYDFKRGYEAALSEIEKCEPVYLARRIGTGLDYFTCDKQRFDELSVNKLFHTKTTFTSPQPRDCEPVAEAIRERDRLGFAVVNVIGKLDEIIENTQEVEIDNFLHIAVPIDMWNELQAALEDMPKRADLYTSPQSRDWVGLTDEDIRQCEQYPSRLYADHAKIIEAKLKQLNTKG